MSNLKNRSSKGQHKKTKEHKFTVQQPAELMTFLMSQFPGKSRNSIKSLLSNKLVQVNGNVQSLFNLKLTTGQTVTIGAPAPKQEISIPGLKIVFEDKDLIVILKPTGLLTMGSDKERNRTAYAYLNTYVKKESEKNRIFIVHRLDRETSGLLVFAKSEKIKSKLQENWNDTIIERTYIALVEGNVRKDKDTVHSFLRESKALIVHSSQNPTYGQEAITHYEVIHRKAGSTLLKVNLETGRKNQIRVHMQEIGHPIVGDKKYGSKTNPIGRLGLHARVLAFKHPVTGEVVRFETEIPAKFN